MIRIWYVTNGVDVKTLYSYHDAMEFLSVNRDYYLMMD